MEEQEIKYDYSWNKNFVIYTVLAVTLGWCAGSFISKNYTHSSLEDKTNTFIFNDSTDMNQPMFIPTYL
jgi:hypothetical protein